MRRNTRSGLSGPFDRGWRSGFSSPFTLGAAGAAAVSDAYAIGGASPELVAAFTTQSDGTTAGEYYRKASSETTFSGLFTFSRSGTATYFDSNGTLQTAADGVARTQAYRYNSGWELAGMQMEAAAATQLLHGTDSFATQTETVTAQAYTLQFRGTGSITLSGAHSATLNGTGANDLVSLTFTPSAGTLTLTPAGTVNYPQLETGSTPSSYIPNTAASGTVTRAAETLSIANADVPFDATATTWRIKGLLTYADDESSYDLMTMNVSTFEMYIITAGSNTGLAIIAGRTVGTEYAYSAGDYMSPGVNVPFNLAGVAGANIARLAADGVIDAIQDETGGITGAASSDLVIFGPEASSGFISEIRVLAADSSDSALEAVTS